MPSLKVAFGSIQWHFIRDIRPKFCIPDLVWSPDIGQNSNGGISDFQISDQFLIKKDFHNSRTSNNFDLKLGPVTKHNDVENNCRWRHIGKFWCRCHFSDLRPIWSNLQARFWTHGLYNLFSLITFYLAKTENRTKKSLTQLSYYCFE